MLPNPSLSVPPGSPEQGSPMQGGGGPPQGEDMKRVLTEALRKIIMLAEQSGISIEELLSSVVGGDEMASPQPPTEGAPPPL